MVRWRQQLCMPHVRLRGTSQAVIQVHCKREGATDAEVVAWAYAPIVHVVT